MKVITGAGSIELGEIETGATIGIADYSRRVTDDFGVTTVVKRGFARRMSVNIGVPFGHVDDVQQLLADLRATPATWIADDRFGSFSIDGFYKDFEVNLAVPPLSFCALTVEGLTEEEAFADPGGDPAIEGLSTLRLLDPVEIVGAKLVSSTVPEDDAPAWSAGTTYSAGARVILATTHRVYESVVDGNVGADPTGTDGKWIVVGPTNRWAAFDQALGTATVLDDDVEVVLQPGAAIGALALLDTSAGSVRVRAPGYDRTQNPARGKALFLDLAVAAGDTITITATPASFAGGDRRWDDGSHWLDEDVWQDSQAAGDGTVIIGTMLVGVLRDLGVTEAAPTTGITDYSRKVTEDFGDTTVVQRAYSKRMSVKAAIRTDAIDLVMGRMAAVRAKPCLWLGDASVDALAIYGFFRDFDIRVHTSVSILSLSIEGLSKAAPVVPPAPSSTAWPDITDPDGTKPADNADVTGENTSKDTAAVGGLGSAELLARLAAAKARTDTLENVTIPAINQAMTDADNRIGIARGRADAAQSRADGAFDEIASEAGRLDLRIDGISASGGYDDTDVRAKITEARGIAVGARDAVAQLETEVETSVGDLDTKYDARIKSTAKTAADETKAVSDRLEAYIAEGGGTGGGEGVDTYARSEIIKTNKAFADADTALGQRVDKVETDYKAANTTTNTRITDEVKALSDADTAFGQRASALEAQMSGANASGLRSRISSVETAVTDGRFATAQRASNLETDVGNVKGRLTTVETATTDGRFAAASRVTQLETYTEGVGSKVEQHVVSISNLQGRTAAYVRYVAVAGANRAQLTLSADANGGAGVDLVGDLTLHGNLIIPSSVGTIQIGNNAVTIGGGSTASGPATLQEESDGTWALLNRYTIALPYGGTMIAFASAYVGHPNSDVGNFASTLDITAKQISGGSGFLRPGRRSEYSANGSMREVNGQISLPAGTWQIDFRGISGLGAPSYADERKLFVLASMR